MRRRRAAACLVAVALLLLGAALVPAPAAAAPALPRLTMIGDSVASAIAYEQTAQATLRRGADVSLQLAPCRRVGQTSCPHNGTTAPNVLQLIPTLGDTLAGSTVIVAVGYNDYQQEYARNIEDALAALRGAGVQRVLWVTLRAERQSYLAMNEMIRDAAARHPELTVVDWNI